ncbi:uncharacterized protein LOC123917935 [Trifolium pratense]|nr:uncharacterized protein LOC123917935 [Trifolium pratense]XP_045825803.1 uncharacterized protein LOC123917935 [Trifolium pratense]XP_045825804.1 uncharacterized protein LOC123917935 [Trifolium pratense]
MFKFNCLRPLFASLMQKRGLEIIFYAAVIILPPIHLLASHHFRLYMVEVLPLSALIHCREDMLCLLRNKLLKAQNTMKLQADRKHINHQFSLGEFVFVKLRPYRQTSVEGHRIQKLSKRFFGPFKIIRQIGDVALELELPASNKIHPVFHVSKLKLSYTTPSNISALPVDTVHAQAQPVLQPLAVLDWKRDSETASPLVLIQWEGLFPEDATWEPYDDMLRVYPDFHLEDKVHFEGERNVMGLDEPREEEYKGPIPHLKAKRNIMKPIWQKDYVMTKPK